MPRWPKKEIVYTGKAAKINEKIQKLQADLKTAKEELKVAYKEQLKAEKAAAAKEKKASAIAAKKEMRSLLKAIHESGLSVEDVLELLQK